MRARSAVLGAAAALAAIPYVLGAQGDADAILKQIVNVPPVTAWHIDGMTGKPKLRSDPAVQYGRAVRIEVPGKGEHPWSIAASNPIEKPVKAGDNLVLAFWARLEAGENGATSATLPYNAVQMSHDPYTALFSAPATIGPQWKMVEIKGKADRNYAGGELNVSIHLATGKQIVDLGPVFVLDTGP